MLRCEPHTAQIQAQTAATRNACIKRKFYRAVLETLNLHCFAFSVNALYLSHTHGFWIRRKHELKHMPWITFCSCVYFALCAQKWIFWINWLVFLLVRLFASRKSPPHHRINCRFANLCAKTCCEENRNLIYLKRFRRSRFEHMCKTNKSLNKDSRQLHNFHSLPQHFCGKQETMKMMRLFIYFLFGVKRQKQNLRSHTKHSHADTKEK